MSKRLNNISIVQNILRACRRLPSISILPQSPGSILPAADLVLGTPVTWWLMHHPDPPVVLKKPLDSTLWMLQLFTVDPTTRLLDTIAIADIPNIQQEAVNLYNRLRLNRVLFKPEIGWAIDNPSFDISTQNTLQALENLRLLLPNGTTTPFSTASKYDLRSFLNPPAPDRSNSTKKQWHAFWKSNITKPARNLWWRHIHHATPCAQFRAERWPHPGLTATCPVCSHPQEDRLHYLALCPNKRSAWTSLLQKYTTRTQWSEQDIASIFVLSSHPTCVPMIHTAGLSSFQLVSCGLSGIAQFNIIQYKENRSLSSVALEQIMFNHAVKVQKFNSVTSYQ